MQNKLFASDGRGGRAGFGSVAFNRQSDVAASAVLPTQGGSDSSWHARARRPLAQPGHKCMARVLRGGCLGLHLGGSTLLHRAAMSPRRGQRLAGLGDLEPPQAVTFCGPLACSQVIFQPESPLPKINSAIFPAASLHFSFGIPDFSPNLGRCRFRKVYLGASWAASS